MNVHVLIYLIFFVLTGCVPIAPPGTDQIRVGEPATPERPENQAVDDLARFRPYHYTGKHCRDCHLRVPETGGDPLLRYNGDFNVLCKCHLKGPGGYVHPVDITLDASQKDRVPDSLPLTNEALTCLTCHDIYRQCEKERIDAFSLRGAPYPNRTAFCFRCHPKGDYSALNPHIQLNPDGEIMEEICLYCHLEKPDEAKTGYDNIRLLGDLEGLCRRCHRIKGNHSGNFNHLIKPSDKMRVHMEGMEKQFGIILPLAPNGKMTCATCHNPHDVGVIPPEKPAAKGAGSKYRHRLPGRLCIECHRMDVPSPSKREASGST